jgi:poly(3-hydroxybutyrate) depolymerase
MQITSLAAALAGAMLAGALLSPASVQAPFATGAHLFTYTDRGPLGTYEIEVPAVAGTACAAKRCPLVIAMTGLTRNAFQTRDNWLTLAEAKGLLVVSPFLDSTRFPTRLYQQGGMVGEPDRSKWIYNIIERLYDHLVAAGRAEPDGYILFGHSAGAQFVHRMVLAMPDARYRIAIAANAGFYTLPTGAEEAGGHPMPFSLEGTPITEAERAKALQRPLLLMLGDQDNDPNHHQLNNSDGAKAQGPHRLARGNFFFAAAEAEANRLGVPFGWRKIVVPGVGHDNTRMAEAAARALFP